jgi:PAS domain-containing protein
MSESSIRLFKYLRIYCRTSAIAAIGGGCLVLCGWIFHVPVLKSVLPGLVTMKVNTALGIAFSGIPLWLLLPADSNNRKTYIARFLAIFVALLGAASLSEYLFGWNLGIDQLLISDPEGSLGTTSPGRMAPTSATAFVAMGLALLLLDWKTRRGHRPAQGLSLWVGMIAILAITGYIYHATALYRILLYTQVALHTAVALFVLSVAIIFARPRTGIARDLTSEGPGGVMARRLVPAIIFIPILLGWIALKGQNAGLFGAKLGFALYATATTFVFAALVWLTARKINEEYEQRSAAETEIRELNISLEARVVERTRALELQTAVLAQHAALLDLAHEAIIVRDIQYRILFLEPRRGDHVRVAGRNSRGQDRL